MTLLNLFWSFFQIGLFSIGGGYAALPLIQQQVVVQHGWLTLTEFADAITISQMMPGSIAINAATFVGTRIAGLSGAVIATFGCVLPSSLIVLTLAWLYGRYRQLSLVQGVLGALRPAVVAFIASAGYTILKLVIWKTGVPSLAFANFNVLAIAIFGLSLLLLRRWKMPPTVIMLGAGVIGVIGFALLEGLG